MDLIQPAVGQMIWASLVFVILLFLLAKFAWKPILKAVNEREKSIAESIALADSTKAEMKQLQAQNETLLRDARIERDNMIKDATETGKRIIQESKETAKIEFEKIVAEAQEVIKSEKSAALADLKTQVASLSLEIAEKVIKGELASNDKQKALADKLAGDISLN
ncbi:MAG: F0F1 ATP synthase subunit B [Crocinitomicaceae bacterium]|jgi:F-type H+-transporting ATPase subunit b|nr:F0F1 ATP synthase subunit B [Crocinitomicaceae bacterium]MBK9591813.1 F0F1 ATP synthase subunit B [Crocinitomicaceae bacterium]